MKQGNKSVNIKDTVGKIIRVADYTMNNDSYTDNNGNTRFFNTLEIVDPQGNIFTTGSAAFAQGFLRCNPWVPGTLIAPRMALSKAGNQYLVCLAVNPADGQPVIPDTLQIVPLAPVGYGYNAPQGGYNQQGGNFPNMQNPAQGYGVQAGYTTTEQPQNSGNF